MNVKKKDQALVEVSEICQLCYWHENKPSTCYIVLLAPIPTGRKETCGYFKRDIKKSLRFAQKSVLYVTSK